MKFQHKMVVAFHLELLECLITQQQIIATILYEMNSYILFCHLIYFLYCFPPPENRFHNSLKDHHLLSYLLLCKNPPQNLVVKTMISCFSSFGGLAIWVVLPLVFPGTTYVMAVT